MPLSYVRRGYRIGTDASPADEREVTGFSDHLPNGLEAAEGMNKMTIFAFVE